eukprot:TRINITY_DN2493_c0_g1_i2.p1 TRINITY_DN2493_c0_g1~~TRINITY_DN2493_c0_g1_i2.p1  ORF type:complete len:703 (-),score=258.59 TRINITY_DN2493_c0_g1_i2:6-2114(-)
MPKQKKQKKVVKQSKEVIRRNILKHYDRKQYRKAMKMCDDVIKTNDDHGEALSLRGLCHLQLNEEERALEDANAGLRKDVQSFLCWNVLGMIYRSKKDYAQAAKFYKGALRNDPPQKASIMRDLAMVQIHVRDVAGYLATRHQMFMDNPKQGHHWMGFAVATHLCGNLDQAVKVLTSYADIITNKDDMEYSEVIMYRHSILEERGDLEEVLKDLYEIRPRVADKTLLREKEADLLFRMGRAAEAEPIYRELLELNPENLQYHKGLQKVLALEPAADGSYTEEQVTKLRALYEELREKLPRWSLITRGMPIFFESGDKLREELAAYVKPALIKGQPALHSTIAPLYRDSAKVQVVESLLLSFLESLKKEGKFPGDEATAAPSALLWTLVFLAHHYCATDQYDEAFKMLEGARQHTPTALEVYMARAKVFKRAGAVKMAANAIDEARKLDLADRFLNSKCTKYMLRANRVDEAQVVGTLFTKAEGGVNNLYEMQCMWYEQERGNAFQRLGNMGMALKNYLDIEKHFDTIVEDQTDFHSYCLRKSTMCAYVEMLRFEDSLYGHERIFLALSNAVQCYVRLHDKPVYEDFDATPPEDMAQKDKVKWKKQMKKKKDELVARVNAMSGDALEAHKLEQTKTPLEDALKWLRLLLVHHPDRVLTHVCAFKVYIRRSTFVVASCPLLLLHPLTLTPPFSLPSSSFSSFSS